MWRRQISKLTAVITLVLMCVQVPVLAQSSSSGSYKVDEYQFGTGANNDLNSASYNANASVGSLGVGRSSSTNYDAEAGFITPNEPFLELFVNNSNIDLGNLDTSATGTGQGVFWVRTYLSSAYVVQTMSNPPTSEGGRVLAAKSTLGVPSPGTEEFGINLVDNTTPNIGADPLNVPDNTYADGTVNAGYNTPDQFKYGVGDIIAHSAATAGNQAVGRTDYTISYIANVNAITPAGTYVMVHDIVVTGTY
jgi:hypothetical protein